MPNPCSMPCASVGRMPGGAPSKWLGIERIASAASVNGGEDITCALSFPSDWTRSGTVEDGHQSSMLGNTAVAMSLNAASVGSSKPAQWPRALKIGHPLFGHD